MSRYIDADKPIKIVREYKSNIARMIDNYIDVDDVIDMFEDMIDDFENIPTADVVEVVRCKDCKRRYYDKERDMFYCQLYFGLGSVRDNNYCCFGVKK